MLEISRQVCRRKLALNSAGHRPSRTKFGDPSTKPVMGNFGLAVFSSIPNKTYLPVHFSSNPEDMGWIFQVYMIRDKDIWLGMKHRIVALQDQSWPFLHLKDFASAIDYNSSSTTFPQQTEYFEVSFMSSADSTGRSLKLRVMYLKKLLTPVSSCLKVIWSNFGHRIG